MSQKKIFPDAIIKQSVEQLIYDNSKASKVVYMTALLAFVVAFVLMFYIEVDVGVQAVGMIKPKGERNVITAPISGRLMIVNLTENTSINAGDTLFAVVSDYITSQLPALEKRQEELTSMLSDLEYLLKRGNNSNRLQSPIYIQALTYYKTQISELTLRRDVADKRHNRDKLLFDSKVLSTSEFEASESELNNAKIAINVFDDGQRAKWQSEKIAYSTELRDIETQIAQIAIQNNEAIICAPVSGAIQKIASVSDGMYVHSGQNIAELSPDGELVAECYLSPKDIGLVRIGQEGRIRVDAYNYNDWGTIDGQIIDIFKDVVLSDGSQPYYRIYCSLDSNYLTLKNGYKGEVKKGMSMSVRFIVIRRTLFHLLYDKIDNWLNPSL